MAAIAVVATLAACAQPGTHRVGEPWNGGTWNSVLGYVGPYNQMQESPGR